MKHPRPDPSFTCSRRTFFRALFQEIAIIHRSLKGRPGYRLTELGSLPDCQLAEVRPTLNPDRETFVDQDHVCSRSKKTQATLKLFPPDKENLMAFEMFDGRHDLSEIGSHLAQEMGWGETRAFAHSPATGQQRSRTASVRAGGDEQHPTFWSALPMFCAKRVAGSTCGRRSPTRHYTARPRSQNISAISAWRGMVPGLSHV